MLTPNEIRNEQQTISEINELRDEIKKNYPIALQQKLYCLCSQGSLAFIICACQHALYKSFPNCVISELESQYQTKLNVYIVEDAVGSRYDNDHKISLRRLEKNCVITTTESIIFEWCKTSDRNEFKKIRISVNLRMDNINNVLGILNRSE